ncbi:MAG: ABC transporter ATP-binding protein [Clostridia bacterium]|nr:ABC transporter ATP-binding protein [Clostridia bacterium]
MAQLTCDKVTLGYDGKVVRENVSFSVKSGDYLCIIGENGSGKSTLMKTILGLKAPMSGKISYGDGLKEKEIGYLPQQTDIQKDFPASVYEIVLSGCLSKLGAKPFYTKKQKDMANYQIHRLGLDNLKKRCYRELSGGQQQRVLLARALCATKKMILLDEPVSGLDPKVTADMYELIDALNKKDGITVIMISHDIKSTLTYATHILHVGKDIFFGTKQEYLKSDFAKVFANKGGEE